MEHEARLVELLEADDRVMRLLRAVRDLGVEPWCVAAGTIRNVVWDDLHGLTGPTLPSDVDVLVYDPIRTDPSYERALEELLSAAVPEVRWEVVNQATIHTYTGDPVPYASIADAMSRWADLVTAVGAHLDADDVITVIAPGGLEDLFALRVRPNLATPTAAAVYRERMASKGWKDRWPRLTIEGLPEDAGA
jgi:uncharacterized protein